MDQIKETYRGFGFTQIETPCVEHIENLTSKQGGDNEKLIFKILKRGEKLNLETAETENDLADSGLRYDLTLPLSRYYANNGGPAAVAVQGAADGERLAGRPAAERAVPPVCPVRHRHSGRPHQSGGDRTDSGHHHGAGPDLPGQRLYGAHQRPARS